MNRSDRTYTQELDGYSLSVWPDPDAVSPRDAGFKNLGTVMIAPARRFERMTSDDPSDMTDLEQLKSRMAEASDSLALPLYAISTASHGTEVPFYQLHDKPFLGKKQGLLVGFIATTHADALDYFSRETMNEDVYREALDRLGDEIMLMNTFLADEVYCFEVRDDRGELLADGKSIYEADLAFDEAVLEIHRIRENAPSAFMM